MASSDALKYTFFHKAYGVTVLAPAKNNGWCYLAQVLAFICLLLASQGAIAASRPLTTLAGQVCNQANTPIPGVVIMVKGQGTATTTNAGGNFVLACEEETPLLILNCAGYQTQTLLVQKSNPLAIVLYKVGEVAPIRAGLEANRASIVVADEPPAFPGGVAAYRLYLKQNFHYPAEAQKQSTSCSVLVGFVVDEMGRILEAEVAKGCGVGLDEEALRLVRLMPWWTPAHLKGNPVRAATYLRIKFELQ